MRIEYICDLDNLDNLDIHISKNGLLKYKKKNNQQFKTGFIHDECENCGSMYISSLKNSKFCSISKEEIYELYQNSNI